MMARGFGYMNRYLWDIVLYSCLGCFSYFFLVHYADIPVRYQEKLITFQAFLSVIVVFCGVGLSIRYINHKLLSYYSYFLRNKRMLFVGLLSAAVILGVSNYLLLVSAKFIVGVSRPFLLQINGLTIILVVWLVELMIVWQFMLNRFYADLVRLYRRAKELEESTAQARYMALQHQLNPHFLFNSLNTLVAEIEYDPAGAAEFTRNLADTYRYILYCQDKHTVTLGEELNFLEVYIQLQKVRLGDCLTMDQQIDARYEEVLVPPLSLQLLVENVIKHNVINIRKPMRISLWTEIYGKSAWLCVANDMHPKQGAISGGTGLKNLAQRCRMLCGKEPVVMDDGDKFIVKLPLLYEED